jgi:hypothetical protein
MFQDKYICMYGQSSTKITIENIQFNTYFFMPLLLWVSGNCSNGKRQESKSDAFYTCMIWLGCKNVSLTKTKSKPILKNVVN